MKMETKKLKTNFAYLKGYAITTHFNEKCF